MKRMNFKSIIGLMIMLFLFQLLFGCTPTSSSPEATQAPAQTEAVAAITVEQPTEAKVPTGAPTQEVSQVGGTLVIAASMEPDTLDMQKTAQSSSWSVMHWVGGALLTSRNGEYLPYLAESWTVSDDGRTLDFKLKHDVKFHDGTLLTAQDWVYTFTRAMDPEIASPVAASMLGGLVSAEAVDDYTLRLKMSQANAGIFFSLTDRGYLEPLSQESVDTLGDQFGRSPVGVGPYIFKEWVTGDHITLVRNPDFTWGPESDDNSGPYTIESIEFRFIPEYSTQIAGLEAGEIDLVSLLPQDVERINDLGIVQMFEIPARGFMPYVALNLSKPPFDDLRVRQALSMAIDREALMGLVIQGMGVVQNGPLSSAVMGYWPGVEEIGYPYDMEQAKTLMAEAGYIANADGILEKDSVALTMPLYVFNGDDMATKTAQALQSSLRELGFNFEIQQMDGGVLFPQMLAGDYEIGISGFIWGEADILNMGFHSSQIGVLNYHFTNDPELDALLDQERSEMDPVARQEILNTIQQRFVEQVYFIPLFAPNSYYALSNRVKDASFNIGVGNFDFSAAHIDN
jgi:peptide/nickel transport system substrate-binding protein